MKVQCAIRTLEAWHDGDGWYVNNQWTEDARVTFYQPREDADWNAANILQALKDIEYFKPEVTVKDIMIEDWFDDSILITKTDDGEPLCQLLIKWTD